MRRVQFDKSPPAGVSRRGFVTAAALSALAITTTEIGAFASPAAAAIVWGHPFTELRAPSYWWGPRRQQDGTYKHHAGIDYPRADGTPLYAVADGRVFWKGDPTGPHGYGYYIEIEHANGWRSFFGHMNRPSPLPVGATVTRGQHVGWVGNTGNSYGAHLHVELRYPNGADMDPRPYIHDGALLPGQSAPTPPPPPGEPVPIYTIKQVTHPITLYTRAELDVKPNAGPGKWWRLFDSVGQRVDLATGAGTHDVALHFIGTGLPVGETVDVRLVRATGTSESPHYTGQILGVADGAFTQTLNFKLPIAAGQNLWLDTVSSVSGAQLSHWGASILNFQG